MALNRNLLRSTRPGDARPGGGGQVQVLIALKTAKLSSAARERLTALGLSIERITDNKLVASLHSDVIEALRADPDVAEVETAMPLKMHRRPAPQPPPR